MAAISSYSFGRITVAGNQYTNDIIVYNDELIDDYWWRIDGHLLHIEDLKELKDKAPAKLFIGCGHDGVMKVPDKVLTELNNWGFEVHTTKTTTAVEQYNQAEQPKLGAFHLTC